MAFCYVRKEDAPLVARTGQSAAGFWALSAGTFCTNAY